MFLIIYFRPTNEVGKLTICHFQRLLMFLLFVSSS